MKKKITNYFLLLAIAIVGLSSFVSCKDYESDDTVSMKEQLRDIIIKQAGDVSDLVSRLQALQGKVGSTDQFAGKTLAEALAEASTTATQAKNAASQANEQLSALFGEVTNLNQAVSSLQCVTDLAGRVTTVEEILNGKDGQAGVVEKLSGIRTELDNLYNGWTGNLMDLSKDAAKALALAKEDSARIDAIDLLLIDHTKLLTDHADSIAEINTKLNKEISLLNGKYDALQTAVSTAQSTANEAKNDASAAKTAAEAAKTAADAAKQEAAAAKAEAIKLFNKSKELIDSANAVAKAYADSLHNESKLYADGQIRLAKADLERAFKAADDALNAKIDSLDAALNTLLNKLSDQMYKMVTGVVIQGTENYVTGSINTPFDISTNILAAFYGYNQTGVNVTFPMGEGRGYSSCYVRPEEAVGFTPLIEGVSVAEAEGVMMYGDSEEFGGNAGKLYVTVNPSSADMSGLKFTLVDTRDDAAAGYGEFTLNKCNDRQMMFGWTRSADNNGFYVANANVVDPQAAKPSVDVEALKKVAQNVLNKITAPGENRLNITEAVSTVYKELNNKLVAYAVKIPGKYTDSEGVERDRNIYSQYKLAATAVKPLSYATLKDGINKQIPMLPTLESKGITIDMDQFKWTPIEEMDSIEVEIKLDEYPDINNITIDGSRVEDVKVDVTQPKVTVKKKYLKKDGSDATYYTEEQIKGHESDYYLADVEVSVSDADVKVGKIDFSKVKATIGTKTETLTVKVPMDQFNKIIADINDQVGGMLDNVTEIADKLNNMVPTVDKYINKVNSFIQKLNNKLRDVNSLLQITLMYETADGSFAQVNAVKGTSTATQMKLGGRTEGAILLKPTSYTAEMFAPALKKYVAVTSAPSAAAQAFANAGENMNKVLDGRCRDVVFQANAKGLYEITYSAVDFYGYITTRKFYINVE